MLVFRIKNYTQWDETDNLKRSRDSDILAAQKKKTTDWGKVGKSSLVGAGIGAVANNAMGFFNKGFRGLGMGRTKWGAAIGGALGAGIGYASQGKQRSEANFYNNRLEYAQRQAKNREQRDWRNQMTRREDYSY